MLTLRILTILISIVYQSESCEELSIDEAYKQADYIFIGTVESVFDKKDTKFVSLFIKEQFKSNFFAHYELAIIIPNTNSDCAIPFERAVDYLIYSTGSSLDELQTSHALRSKELKKAQAELDFLNELPCNEGKISKRACFRHLSPVCGCDGVTYGNACGASNAGITQWKEGECQ